VRLVINSYTGSEINTLIKLLEQSISNQNTRQTVV
jgi:hypothetical protein